MLLPRLSLSSLLFSLLAATTATASSSSLTITIPPSNILPNPNALLAGTHATLTSLPSSDQEKHNHPLTAPLTRSATFVFRHLPSKLAQPESYLLDIRSAEYVFAPYRVDISAEGIVLGVWETFRGNTWENRGAEKFVVDVAAKKKSTDVTVEAKVLARRGFYEERAKFSPLSLFKNPMILLAVVALGFTFGMPKLMENMDPEFREEFEKQSRSSPISGASRQAMGGGGAANFDLAGWMAGTAAPGPVASADAPAQSAASGRESSGATRRRG
ncbi:hypothetical protein ASPWEDRAFT_53134 [Aspergillus wentii DTO 134E9]|uniref:ER membrane protein complex subunit 7 beta-sandwich domain-containing protein n=1 Tax=Aspergillus wentii DTO 134E9 TaxID=1073089 RepID=A0A1L9RDU7_ASPWE|nr:uncharacterized protein ASPWEDRAFT_53134 [Aspergillus wentii DTO 134E9]KAI9933361.1 hypothetical protein MW887_007834 [Aspergillus wentii]OJJ33091.1 hypothetical protein ASPWEDRAFT_53134 [Aspergillus wentii DTO 134E9]